MPLKEGEENRSHIGEKENSKGIATVVKKLIFPPVACVIIFTIVACITERRKLLSDPLNFSTLNVIFEVVRYIKKFLCNTILSSIFLFKIWGR